MADIRSELKSIRDFHLFCLLALQPELEEHAAVTVPTFHWDIYQRLDSPQQGQTSGVLIVAPVGFAKSTVFKIWGCYQLLWRIDPYILYVSSSIDKAVDQFGGVKKILKDADLQAIFEFSIIRENTTEVLVKWRDETTSKFEAVASGQDISGINYEGQRPTLILIDDIEEVDQARNADRTNQLEEWMRLTLFSRTPSSATGRIRMIGTVFSRDSLASRILGKSKTYDKPTFKNWLTVMYQALDDRHRSIWEDRHPTHSLLELRSVDPYSFAANYMNDPLDEVITGAYYERELSQVIAEGRYGEHIAHNPAQPVDTWWDFAVTSDLNAVWFTQKREGGGINLIDYWEGTGLSIRQIADIILSKGYLYGTHHAPHDIKKTHAGETANRTLQSMYASVGLSFAVVGSSSVESGRNAVRLIMQHLHFAANANVATGFNHLRAYRAVAIPNTDGLTKERHDIHSHCADALRIMAVHASMSGPAPVGSAQKTTLSKLKQIKSYAHT